jgi:hypothetical protein
LKATNNSIQELGVYDTGVITDTKEVLGKDGLSPVALTLISIVIIVLGSIIGLGLMVLHKTNKITIPLIGRLQKD